MGGKSAAYDDRLEQQWVLRNLRVNAVMAMRHGDRSAAARSLELIGRHLSMFADRKAIEISYVDDVDEYLAKLLQLVQAPVLEHEPQQLEQQPKQLEHDAEDGLEYGSADAARTKSH